MSEFDLDKFKACAIAVDRFDRKYKLIAFCDDYIKVLAFEFDYVCSSERWLDGTYYKGEEGTLDLISLIDPEPEYEEKTFWHNVYYSYNCLLFSISYDDEEKCKRDANMDQKIGYVDTRSITIKVKK